MRNVLSGEGRVSFIHPKEGYGFVKNAEGAQFYFRLTAIVGFPGALCYLKTGAPVEFLYTPKPNGKKRPCIKKMVLLDAEEYSHQDIVVITV